MIGEKMRIFFPKEITWQGRQFLNNDSLPIGGSIKATYECDDSIFQVYPLVDGSFPQCLKDITRKFVPDSHTDIQLYYQNLSRIKASITDIKISFAALLNSADFKIDQSKGVICEWKRDLGNKFDDLREEVILLGIINFLKTLHQNVGFFGGENKKSLSIYYTERFENIKSCLLYIALNDRSKSEFVNFVIKVIELNMENIHKIVFPTEVVSSIHGDLRSENILYNRTDERLCLIDIDQGVYGGDWYCDFWKIGFLSDGFLSKFSILDKNQQKKYFSHYLYGRGVIPDNLLFDEEVIFKRIGLIRLDFLLSVYILRYYMGWNFFTTNNSLGTSVRGCLFIQDIIRTAFS